MSMPSVQRWSDWVRPTSESVEEATEVHGCELSVPVILSVSLFVPVAIHNWGE